MNVVRLNEILSDNEDAIMTILEGVGCASMRYNPSRKEIRCAREEGKNPLAVSVKVDSLYFKCFSTNEQGSIYNFVMNKLDLSFPEALNWVADLLNIDRSELKGDVKLPFGGFYKHLIKSSSEPEMAMQTYDKSVLDKYGLSSNLAFLWDGISLDIQERFHLGYDWETDRITIPQWNMNGELVGIMGRSNDPLIPHEFRWHPIIPCPRSYTLFGYHQNYAKIQQQQLCVVTESEKGVMQLATMGKNYGLATCTKSISAVQERYLKALRVEKIVLAYDQGLSQEELEHEATKLKLMNPIYKNKVGYIYDPKGDILALDSKDSPTDLGSKAFETLLNKYTIWI